MTPSSTPMRFSRKWVRRMSKSPIPLNASGVKGTLSVWARNLFNEDHIYRRSDANNSILGSYANFNPPRTFGLQGTVNF